MRGGSGLCVCVALGMALGAGVVRPAHAFDVHDLSQLFVEGRQLPAQTVVIAAPIVQPARRDAAPARERWAVPMYATFVGLQALDVHSSIRAADQGYEEANPLLRWAHGNPAALIATKTATTAATLYVVDRIRRHHPRGALAIMIALNITYSAVVIHNYRTVR